MKIRWKLIFTLGGALVLNLSVGIYAAATYRLATAEATRISDHATGIVTESLTAEVHFKKQVQEWKNILLRGHEPELYARYLRQFSDEEEATREKTTKLLNQVNHGTEAWRLADAFLQAHQSLGRQYREALDTFDPEQPGDLLRVDRIVRGIDRQPTELMEKVVVATLNFRADSLRRLDVQLRAVERQILLAAGLLLVLTLFFLLWIANRSIALPIGEATSVARRITAGNLNGAIPTGKRDEAGDLLRAMQTMQDSLAQSRRELQDERTGLADRVARRTEALNLANAELARAAKTKDLFLATMSHELRTPLTTILGYTEMLQDGLYGTVNEGESHALATIEESSRHLLNLINDILDVAKVESGKMVLKWDYLPMQQLVESSLRLVRQAAKRKKQTIELELDGRVKLIHCDAQRLKQLLVNLLDNAIKFTPDEGRIGLSIEGRPDENLLTFTVWDTGIGIDTSHQQQLFEPFVQVEDATSRRHGGTGLGLTLVRRMAELHGGNVSVSSSPWRGSRFIVTLPWKEGESPVDIPAAGVEESNEHADALSAAPRTTLLLVEDNEANRTMIAEYLGQSGFTVVSTGSGREALELATARQPGIILMDIQLDDMNGLEITRRLREMPQFRLTPIIAFTALAMPGDREKCLEAGMDDYLSKPVGLRTIRDHLVALLCNRNRLA